MAQGDSIKALRIMSIARGWDPNVIPAGGGKPEENMGNFNKYSPRPGEGDASVGQLPEGIHDSYPQAEEPRYNESVTFDVPDASRENKDRRTSGADPYSGMDGM